MKHSDSLAAIGAALARAQGQVKIALKDSDNPHLRSKYADLGSVWAACREALTANGLSIIQMPVADEPGYIGLETIILHESGEFMANTARTPAKDPKGNETAQSVGSAITYLRRYALSSALGIVADEDDDGHAASQAPQNRQQPAPRQNTRPAPAQEQQQASQAPGGPALTTKQAHQLHERLGSILKGTDWEGQEHNDFAASILGFLPSSFTDLTVTEAKQLQEAAERVPKVSPAA